MDSPPDSVETTERPRRYVVVVDDSPECRLALRFATRWAARSPGRSLILMSVLAPVEFVHWGRVQEVMEQEAREEALALLATLSAELEAEHGTRCSLRIERGGTAAVVLALLASEPDVSGLVLGASATGAPGPLVDFFSGDVAGSLPCPVIIVPGGMAPDRIDGLF